METSKLNSSFGEFARVYYVYIRTVSKAPLITMWASKALPCVCGSSCMILIDGLGPLYHEIMCIPLVGSEKVSII